MAGFFFPSPFPDQPVPIIETIFVSPIVVFIVKIPVLWEN